MMKQRFSESVTTVALIPMFEKRGAGYLSVVREISHL